MSFLDIFWLFMSLDPLFNEYKTNTIFWFIFTGIIGGIIGSFFKFVFDHWLGPKLEKKRKDKEILEKYSNPLTRSLDSFDRRIENLLDISKKDWFDNPKDDYYRISTLYVFGNYFGWAKILELEAYLEFEDDCEVKTFYKCFYRIFKSLTGFDYFKNIGPDDIRDIYSSSVPRFVLTAVGELMIKKNGNSDLGVLSFIEFVKNYSNDPSYQRWFGYLENFIRKVENDKSNPSWNRLVILSISVKTLLFFLDPNNKLAKRRKISNLDYIHPKLIPFIRKEIEEVCLNEVMEN